jgi:hypothetical protein
MVPVMLANQPPVAALYKEADVSLPSPSALAFYIVHIFVCYPETLSAKRLIKVETHAKVHRLAS